jgi:putative flippase GtrA
MRQLLRFAAVGVASNVIGYLLYLLVTYLGAAPKLAMTVLYGVGVITGFVGNRRYAFAHQGRLMATGWRYLMAHSAGYLINLAIQIIMVDHLGYPHQLAQALGICVVAVFLFVVFKYFVFVNADETKSGNLLDIALHVMRNTSKCRTIVRCVDIDRKL